MKLVIFEPENFYNFYPIAYLRPTYELRCGHSLLYEKIIRNHPGLSVSFFCRDCLAETFSSRAPEGASVNDLAGLDDDLLVVNGCILAGNWNLERDGGEEIGMSPEGDLLYVRISRESAVSLPKDDIHAFLAAAAEKLPPKTDESLTLIRYQWELIRHNPEAIVSDFEIAGKSGVEGILHSTATVFGSLENLYIAPEAEVHPQVVIDTKNGPVTIERGAIVFPHSRVEGPCYIGPESQITRGNIHEGCSFGPVVRVGGEVEEIFLFTIDHATKTEINGRRTIHQKFKQNCFWFIAFYCIKEPVTRNLLIVTPIRWFRDDNWAISIDKRSRASG